jgi:tetratricopeptide (TPR) repeat protein
MPSASFRVCLSVLVIVLVGTTSAASAQRGGLGRTTNTSSEAGSSGSIEGRVVLPSGQQLTDRAKITLSTVNDPGLVLYTDTNGNFLFNGLRAATYYVEVAGDPRLYEPVVEQVRLLRGMRYSGLIIHLREKTASGKKATGGTVSIAEVDAHIPAQARKEFEKATALVGESKLEEAIEAFKRAIAIFPNYLMAHNDLGAQYLSLRRYPEAQEHFEAAIEINSKAFNPNLNLGIVLVKQRRFADALERLTQAQAIDSSSPAVHLYLGIASVAVDEIQTAERELTTALSLGGEQFSVAHFYLAHIHLKKGDGQSATRELKTYLEAQPNGENADQARKLLQQVNP